jgi:hypothetical protein
MKVTTLEDIRSATHSAFPSLDVDLNKKGLIVVAGKFPVITPDGSTLDTFDIEITIPETYPRDLPDTREVGGRLPWTAERHVFSNGVCCVIHPADQWRVFPKGSSFDAYLNGPLHNYFLGQCYFEEFGDWPFGEWAHGPAGTIEYYQELLGIEDVTAIIGFIRVLASNRLKAHWPCPCGSGKKIKRCCSRQIRELRSMVPPLQAKRSFASLYIDAIPEPSTSQRLF